MFKRYTYGITVSALITASLLLAMDFLIDSGKSAATPAKKVYFLPFVNVKKAPVEPESTRKIPDRVPSPDVAPALVQPAYENPDGVVVSLHVPGPAEPQVPRLGYSPHASSELLPVVKVAPEYPHAAAKRGLEGYVVVEFTVLPNGAVDDVIVIESSSGIFERAAVSAASRFRYRPRMIDGVAVESHGVRNKISFVMNE